MLAGTAPARASRALEGLARPQTERVDQPPEAEVAHNRPADLHDLLLRVVLEELVEQRLVDVVVVDEEALGVVERSLLGLPEILVAPGRDLVDGFLFQGFTFP